MLKTKNIKFLGLFLISFLVLSLSLLFFMQMTVSAATSRVVSPSEFNFGAVITADIVGDSFTMKSLGIEDTPSVRPAGPLNINLDETPVLTIDIGEINLPFMVLYSDYSLGSESPRYDFFSGVASDIEYRPGDASVLGVHTANLFARHGWTGTKNIRIRIYIFADKTNPVEVAKTNTFNKISFEAIPGPPPPPQRIVNPTEFNFGAVITADIDGYKFTMKSLGTEDTPSVRPAGPLNINLDETPVLTIDIGEINLPFMVLYSDYTLGSESPRYDFFSGAASDIEYRPGDASVLGVHTANLYERHGWTGTKNIRIRIYIFADKTNPVEVAKTNTFNKISFEAAPSIPKPTEAPKPTDPPPPTSPPIPPPLVSPTVLKVEETVAVDKTTSSNDNVTQQQNKNTTTESRVYKGNKSLEFKVAGTCLAYHTVTLEVGKTYTFSAWVMHPEKGAKVSMDSIRWIGAWGGSDSHDALFTYAEHNSEGGHTYGDNALITNGKWQKVWYSFTIPAKSGDPMVGDHVSPGTSPYYSLSIDIRGKGMIYIDEVWLVDNKNPNVNLIEDGGFENAVVGPNEKYFGGADWRGANLVKVGSKYWWPQYGYEVDGSGAISPFAIVSIDVEDTPKEPEKKPELTGKYDAWAAETLKKANELGIIPDDLNGTDFTKAITREQFAAVSVKLYEYFSGEKAVPVANNPFKDTKNEEVLKAYNLGITAGVSATSFNPNGLLTRQEAATMLMRVIKKVAFKGWTLADDSKFKVKYNKPKAFDDDKDIADWAKDNVYFMAANEIIYGKGNNKFAPKDNNTCQEALVITGRIIDNLDIKKIELVGDETITKPTVIDPNKFNFLEYGVVNVKINGNAFTMTSNGKEDTPSMRVNVKVDFDKVSSLTIDTAAINAPVQILYEDFGNEPGVRYDFFTGLTDASTYEPGNKNILGEKSANLAERHGWKGVREIRIRIYIMTDHKNLNKANTFNSISFTNLKENAIIK